jgi:hypothetical protein
MAARYAWVTKNHKLLFAAGALVIAAVGGGLWDGPGG